jgi:4-amino-4-deoxy-L-arabinose transferase-like glycosyltransferase
MKPPVSPTLSWGGHVLVWSGLWLVLVAVALATRPLLPVDETRYLAVAWEMWRDGDWLVPHLNGEPYSHKPPILFWLINLGWTFLGVGDGWARLVAPLFGLGSLFLTALLARRLWPQDGAVPLVAPLILLGSAFWAIFTTLTMFDMILAFATLAGLLGVVRVWRRGGRGGWVVLGAAIGFGILAKGPAILVHTLPVAVLAPLWAMQPPPGGWKRWYVGLAAALGMGALIALAWAGPAAVFGGAAYREAILWGQTAGRMVDSFAHGQPPWWYLAVLPPMLLPWLLWPTLWRALGGARDALADGGVRFCLAWFVPALLAFSLISGKQLHYLLPVFPALALLMAVLMTRRDGSPRTDQRYPAWALAALAVSAAVAVALGPRIGLPAWTAAVQPAWMLLAAAAAVIAALLPAGGLWRRLTTLACVMVAVVVSVHLAARPLLAGAFDLKPLAERLGQWEDAGRPLSHYGKYHGQFHFLGRLKKPMAITGDQEIVEWVATHPDGKIVTYQRRVPPQAEPDFVLPFRSRFITVWDASVVAADPTVVKRSVD